MHVHLGWKLKRTAVTILLVFTTVTASMGATPDAAADSSSTAPSASNEPAATSTVSNSPTASVESRGCWQNPARPITESQFEELRGLNRSTGPTAGKAQQETIVALEAALHPANAEPAAVSNVPQWRRRPQGFPRLLCNKTRRPAIRSTPSALIIRSLSRLEVPSSLRAGSLTSPESSAAQMLAPAT